ncbi:hypothetical protein [Streptomyces sp. NPDC017940]
MAGSPSSGSSSASPAGAADGARQWPAHYAAFDLVHAGADLTV